MENTLITILSTLTYPNNYKKNKSLPPAKAEAVARREIAMMLIAWGIALIAIGSIIIAFQ